MPQKKKTNLQSILLVNLGIIIVSLAVAKLRGKQAEEILIGFAVAFCTDWIAKRIKKEKEKCRASTVLCWGDGRRENVIEFLMRKPEDKAAVRDSLVTVKCRIRKIDKDGTIDTGADLYIKTDKLTYADPWTAMTLKTLRAGDFITVTGHIGEVFAGFMNIEKIEAIEKTVSVQNEGGECDG